MRKENTGASDYNNFQREIVCGGAVNYIERSKFHSLISQFSLGFAHAMLACYKKFNHAYI